MSSGTWSRYGTHYRRLCARAGCGAPAVATLRFQSTQRRAWLVELDDNAARTQGDLCQRHAAALVLPRGWDLQDERASAVADTATPLNGARLPATNGNGSSGNGTRRVRVKRNDGATGPRTAAGRLPGIDSPAAASSDHSEPAARETEAAVEVSAGEDATDNDARSQLVPIGADDGDDVEDALETILDARTPLLQRAFRNARPL
jgi:hypothetical protein